MKLNLKKLHSDFECIVDRALNRIEFRRNGLYIVSIYDCGEQTQYAYASVDRGFYHTIELTEVEP